MSGYARTHVETVLCVPESMSGPLQEPETEEGWRGGSWELVSVTAGPRQFEDPASPVWFTIAWRRGGAR